MGTGERDAAKAMADAIPGTHNKALGADKNYGTKGMLAELRRIGVRPHVAQNTSRHGVPSSMAAPPATRATPNRSMPAEASKRCLAGSNTGGGAGRQFKLRGTGKVSEVFCLHLIAYNLIRLGNLLRPIMAAA